MQSTGFVRKIDALGRITLPIDNRNQFHLEEGDRVEIFTDANYIFLRKYEPGDLFSGELDQLYEYKGRKISHSTILELAQLIGLKE